MIKAVACSVALLSALALSSCSKAPKDVSPYLARAKQYIADGDKVKAEAELQQALRLQPLNPQINLSLAELEEEAGNIEAAVPHYARAAAPDAHLVKAQLRLADILLDSSRYQEAGGQINMTLGASPNDLDALAMRADLEDRQNQTVQALADVNAVLAKDPTNARALAIQASVALRANDIPQAMARISKGLAAHPDDVRLLYLRAAALVTANEPEKAAAALKSIVQSSPRNIVAQVALADLEAKSGRVNEAIDGLRAAMAANPSNQALQVAFVKFLSSHKSVDEVTAYLKGMIASNPDQGLYDLALAGLYRSKGMLSQSKPILDAAKARLGDSPDGLLVQIARANVTHDLGQNPETEADIAAILAVAPKNVDALLFRAQLRFAGGRIEDAINDLLAVVRQEPANAKAFEILSNAYLLQGQTPAAVDAMRRVVALVPGDESSQLKLAAFLQAANNTASAKELMARLRLSNPANPLVWIADAKLAMLRKDFTGATYAISRLEEMRDQAGTVAMLQGQVAFAKGDFAAATKKLQDALAVLPNPDTDLLRTYIDAARTTKQTDSAAAFLTQRIPSLSPEARWTTQIAVLELQAGAGKQREAASAYRQLVSLDPLRPEPYLRYAGSLTQQGSFDEAQRIIAEGITAGVQRSKLLLIQGWIESVAGNLPAAQAAFKEAMQSDPGSLEAANNYASILADAEPKNIEALTEARNHLAGGEHSQDVMIVDTIAWVDYRLGHFDEARTLLESVKAGESDNPQLRFHMGAVLIAAGDRNRGVSILDGVKALNFQGAAEAKALAAS